ncbi:hypothetical protein ACFPFP_33715 [Bradyrhizobium sp. GCM10023182]|uniref:Yip1 domain-containing protein n=1 Tax=Bradyrhizobium zhengyangense TaxID=2911009 RepID=A0ABS9LYZ8_9BRAD|nr:hypothetical protein [Bradyrhizobium zhengyangense]MCG2671892.1 hypothetical protein [Bradyrhizobium zhengyangense]
MGAQARQAVIETIFLARALTTSDQAGIGSPTPQSFRFGPSLLVFAYIVLCCVSLAYVTQFYESILRTGSNADALYATALNIAPFALISILFSVSQFSLGYLLGFYLYTIILGYLWLIQLSKFPYDHALAYASSFASALAFLVPALFITAPIKPRVEISPGTFSKLLTSIFILSAIVVVCGAFFNLRMVRLAEIYTYRGELRFPAWLQ